MSTAEPAVADPRLARAAGAASTVDGDGIRTNAPRATTEDLLRRRRHLPAGHPDRVRLRAQAIEKNLPLANHLAGRYGGRGEPLDDLAQVAALALVKAVDAFDADRGIPFGNYAVPSILGALKRHFRDNAWGMRVPRSAKELARDIIVATAELSQRRGRAPSRAELADHLHVHIDDLAAAVVAAHAYHPASLNRYLSVGGSELADLLGEFEPAYVAVDDRLLLLPLLAALPLRERRILAMRFYAQMTQAHIGAEIGLSQMHVSRLLRHALAQLRGAITPTV